MRIHTPAASIVVSMVLCACPAYAQADATGHWKGSVQVQAMQLEFGIDIARSAAGDLVGTIELPSQRIKGLPLQKITLVGNAVTFWAREDQPFRGTMGADGAIAGEMSVEGLSAPFTMKRTGEAVFEPAPRSAGIDPAITGTWNGTLEAGGRRLRLVLAVDRQKDGTMFAELTDVDEGGLRSPVKLTQQGSTLTIESIAVPATISGTLDDGAKELTGTFTQGPVSLPLTLRRSAAARQDR
jgi:hypothetical protein